MKARQNDTIYIKTYDDLTTHIEDIQRQPEEFTGTSVANIVQPAVVPAEPFKPNRKLVVLAGATVGIFLALFIALIRSALKPAEEKQFSK